MSLSSDAQKSREKRTHTIPLGKSTLKNASASRWSTISKGNDSSSLCGKSRKDCVRSANKRSPHSQDGTTIILCGGAMEAETQPKNRYYFIPTAPDKSIAHG